MLTDPSPPCQRKVKGWPTVTPLMVGKVVNASLPDDCATAATAKARPARIEWANILRELRVIDYIFWVKSRYAMDYLRVGTRGTELDARIRKRV